MSLKQKALLISTQSKNIDQVSLLLSKDTQEVINIWHITKFVHPEFAIQSHLVEVVLLIFSPVIFQGTCINSINFLKYF